MVLCYGNSESLLMAVSINSNDNRVVSVKFKSYHQSYGAAIKFHKTHYYHNKRTSAYRHWYMLRKRHLYPSHWCGQFRSADQGWLNGWKAESGSTKTDIFLSLQIPAYIMYNNSSPYPLHYFRQFFNPSLFFVHNYVIHE